MAEESTSVNGGIEDFLIAYDGNMTFRTYTAILNARSLKDQQAIDKAYEEYVKNNNLLSTKSPMSTVSTVGLSTDEVTAANSNLTNAVKQRTYKNATTEAPNSPRGTFEPGNGTYKNALGKKINGNQSQISPSAGIISNSNCPESGNLFGDFGLDLVNLSRQIEMNLNPGEVPNPCPLQLNKNPVDEFLKGIKRLESGIESLMALPGKVLNNLIDSVNGLVNGLGLPVELNMCLQKTSLQHLQYMASRNTTKLSNMLQSQRNFASSFCANIDKTIDMYDKTVAKAIATPVVTATTKQEPSTMYAIATAMIENDVIERDLLAEIVKGTIGETPNNNTVNTMDMLLYIKISEESKKVYKPTSDASTLNVNLSKVPNSGDILSSAALDAHEKGQTVNPKEFVNIIKEPDKTAMTVATNIRSEDVLNVMIDDFSASTDPLEAFNKIIKLLTALDPNFNAEKLLVKLFNCSTTKDLAIRIMASQDHLGNETALVKNYLNYNSVIFRNVDEELSLTDKVAVLGTLNENGYLNAV